MTRILLTGLVVGLVTIACTEFPNQPVAFPAIHQGASWPNELFVRDTDTLAIQVSLSSGANVTGLRVEWETSDETVLKVTQLHPPANSPLGDSLAVQLRAIATAEAIGSATVKVVIEGGGAFSGAEDTATIMVRERWISVSGGLNHSCAITIDKDAYCWGGGLSGALGNGRPVNSLVPTRVIGLGALKFASVSSGDDNTCGIIVEGVMYCWGSGSLGRLGNGSQNDQFIPGLVSLGRAFVSVSAGQTTCGITQLSESFCWGSNSDLQLGTPLTQSAIDLCGSVPCSLKPLAVRKANGDTLPFSLVDVGTFHTCGISSGSATNGWAMCWGSGTLAPFTEDTIFLLGDSLFKRQVPDTVPPPSGSMQRLEFRSISAGDKHTCGATLAGSAYCWGRNDRGQLGVADRIDRAKPTAVAGELGFVSITAGSSHTCGRTASGDAYCWGANDYGQLGVDSLSTTDQLLPARVLGGHKFTSLSAGDFHTCGVTTAGAVYCWGRNTAGQLGASAPSNVCTVGVFTTPCRLAPARVSEPID